MTNSGMIKFFDCGYDNSNWGPSYTHIHGGMMEKVASSCYTPESLLGQIEKLTPRPEGRYVLLNALGAYEAWGANANGDAFPEWSLLGNRPPVEVEKFVQDKVYPLIPGYSIPPQGSYGGPTFVTNAKVYVNHVNKDPSIACGDVIAQAYNPKMRRVELIVFIYQQRVPDIVAAIDRNDPVPWSMGAKLKFDVCSICGKVSRNRAEYCDHLSTQLRQFLPDGRKVFSYNYFPVFFDISKVGTPADRSAWMLRKVASLDTVKESSMIKREVIAPAKQQTLGTTPIDPKLINFIKERSELDDPTPDPQFTRMIKNYGSDEMLKAMLSLGIIPGNSEMCSMYKDSECVPDNLDLVNPNRQLILFLSPKMGDRSFLDPHFSKRAAKACGRKVKKTPMLAKLANLLGNLDYTTLVQMIETNPTVQMTVNPNALELSLFKSAQAVKAASWLPFIVVCSHLNGVMK